MRAILIGLLLALVALLVQGCRSGIPLFDSGATALNRIASAEELLIETNLLAAKLRDEGLITQKYIDSKLTPELSRAEAIIKNSRAVLRGAPTTQPGGTVDEAKAILESLRKVLLAIQIGHSP